jgi:hypothetical protein
LQGAKLHELDLWRDELIELHVDVAAQNSGLSEVRLTRKTGEVAYLFEIDGAGKLTRWSEEGGLTSTVRISKEEYERLVQESAD